MSKTNVERDEIKNSSKKPVDPTSNKSLLIVSAVVALLATAVTFTHLFVVSPIDAVEFQLSPPISFEGELSPNDKLTKAELLLEDQIYGPESIAVNRKTGIIYTGLKTGLICEINLEGKGKILRAVRLTSLDGCDGSYHSMTKCGRPLGMRIHPETDELYVLDAYLGLFSINWETGGYNCVVLDLNEANQDVTKLYSVDDSAKIAFPRNMGKSTIMCEAVLPNTISFHSIDFSNVSEKVRHFFTGAAPITNNDSAVPTRYLNDFDFLPDGRLVISESSTKFDDRDFIYDLLEHRPNGRLLAYNPETDILSVLIDNLYFPNGIQVIRGKVLIAEMGKARILKFSPSSVNPRVFIDNIPGYPDNIRQGSDGTLWIPIAATRSEGDNWLAARPALRSFMTKLFSPQAVHAIADWATQKYGLVLKVDSESGRVLESLHDRTGHVSEVSIAVEDTHGNLLLGSDTNYFIAKLKL